MDDYHPKRTRAPPARVYEYLGASGDTARLVLAELLAVRKRHKDIWTNLKPEKQDMYLSEPFLDARFTKVIGGPAEWREQLLVSDPLVLCG